MKLFLLLPALMCSLQIVQKDENLTVAGNDNLTAYENLITPSSLATHVYYLASDEMQGRETGTQAQKLAAGYLAAQYRLMGLQPKGTVKDNNNFSPAAFFQPFTVYPVMPQKSSLELIVKGKQTVTADFYAGHSNDLFYFDGGNAREASAPVVFAGYGIEADSLHYNDYKALAQNNISINNKWVMILDDEPMKDERNSLLPTYDHQSSPWSRGFFNKRLALLKAGNPKGILIITDLVPGHKNAFANDAAAAAQNASGIGQLSSFDSTPVVQTWCISARMANHILHQKGITIEALQQKINTDLKPVIFELPGVILAMHIEKAKPLITENVLAYIEGADPVLKNEVVIVSSHYDHLGINSLLKEDQIYNGAADNASGTAACLAMANAFMQAKQNGQGPRRSVLFINFSGEEKGLMGSMYYVYKEPVISLEKTVAAINMDGIGGIDKNHPAKTKNYIYLESKKGLSDELITIAQNMNAASGRNTILTDANAMGFNSDNKAFANEHIPFLYFSTGRTEFYHQLKDEPSTIDYEQMAVNVKLVFATTWQVANQDKRLYAEREHVKRNGFACNPCNLPCDDIVFDKPGTCPICNMWVVPRYSR